MTILVQQQLREAAERLIAEGENCWPATVERFTALANPAAVLAFLNEIDQLTSENVGLKSAKHTVECRFEVSEDTLSCIRGCLRAAESDIDQLKAENAELRRDAERYRWVRQPINGNEVFAMAAGGECGGNMDAAIDQAMTKEQP